MKSSAGIFVVFAVAASLNVPECKGQFTVQQPETTGKVLQVSLLLKEAGVEVMWNADSTNERTLYEIERSVNGIHFSTIGRLASSVVHKISYSYFDSDPPDANNIYYRVRQCTSSNECNYSILRSIKINRPKPLKIYPVMPGNNFRVTYNASNASDVLMIVYNTYGKDVHRESREITPGLNDFTMTIENLPRGYYVLKMVSGSISESVSFVK